MCVPVFTFDSLLREPLLLLSASSSSSSVSSPPFTPTTSLLLLLREDAALLVRSSFTVPRNPFRCQACRMQVMLRRRRRQQAVPLQQPKTTESRWLDTRSLFGGGGGGVVGQVHIARPGEYLIAGWLAGEHSPCLGRSSNSGIG